MRRQSGALCKHNTVNIDNAESRVRNLLSGDLQHLARVAASIRRIGVREQFTDIAQRSGAQQGIRHRVQQRIGVGMADRMPIVRQRDAAQDQRAARLQPMPVVPNPNP